MQIRKKNARKFTFKCDFIANERDKNYHNKAVSEGTSLSYYTSGNPHSSAIVVPL